MDPNSFLWSSARFFFVGPARPGNHLRDCRDIRPTPFCSFEIAQGTRG